MPAPLAKGIIITLTLLTALGGALLANPQVRAWVEEQRRKIAEALRSLGDELDPQSRRQAEAFAYEGRIPGDNRAEPSGAAPPLARRESEAARRAVARATGRDTGIELDETSRRLNRTGSVNGGMIDSATGKLGEEDEAERRRLGREYLAKRNAAKIEARQRAKMRKSGASLTSPDMEASNPLHHASFSAEKDPSSQAHQEVNPWSFDNLVDENGSLKSPSASQDMEKSLELPSPPTTEPKSMGRRAIAIEETVKTEPDVTQPIRQSTAFDTGSRWANPFGDEFELDESGPGYATPRATSQAPAVPPKISLDQDPEISVPGLEEKQPEVNVRESNNEHDEAERIAVQASRYDVRNPVSIDPYDEDLALALSLSTAQEEERQRKVLTNLVRDEETELAAAIAASLAEPEQQHRNILNAQAMVQRRTQAANERAQRRANSAMSNMENRLAAANAMTESNVAAANARVEADLAAAKARMETDLASAKATSEANITNLSKQNIVQEVLVDISDPPVSVPQTSRSRFAGLDQGEESDTDSFYNASPNLQARQPSRITSPFVLPGSEKQRSVHENTAPAAPVTPPPDRLIEIDDDDEEEEESTSLFRPRTSKGHHSFNFRNNNSNLNDDSAEAEGAHTPTTATLSPAVERENISFSSGDEEDFASAKGSVMLSESKSERSFTTDLASRANTDIDTDTESLVNHSEAESASLIDFDEADENERERKRNGEFIGGVVDDAEDEDSSDDEWGSGIRTPGSEWTDVGSVVSEEEVGGQQHQGLLRE